MPCAIRLHSSFVCVAARHAAQHLVVAGLDRQLEMGADTGEVGYGLDDLEAQVGGVRGEKANAGQVLDGVHGVQQVGQPGRVVGAG